MKKICIFIQTFLLILCMLNLSIITSYAEQHKTASCEGGEIYYTINEDNTIKITGGKVSGTILVIPSTISGLPVKEIANRAFCLYDYSSRAIKVVISEGIVSIGKDAFGGIDDNNHGNSILSIPNTLKYIEEKAFFGCYFSEKLVLPDGIEGIGDYAFRGCNFQSISLPKNLKLLGAGAFSGCEDLYDTVIIPQGITEIPYRLFYGCKYLKGIVIPESITKIKEGAFCGCYNLKDINIPNGVTEIEHRVFCQCEKLKSIIIPESVVKIGTAGLFAGCASLETLSIPDSYTEIGSYMYSSCEKLSHIDIPKGVTKIGENAFEYCKALESIYIPKSVTEIDKNAFSECSNLRSITYAKGIPILSGLSRLDRLKSLEYISFSTSVTSILTFSSTVPPTVYYLGSKTDFEQIFEKQIDYGAKYFVDSTWIYSSLGDSNGDESVDMKDVLILRTYIAGKEIAFNRLAADLNDDEEVDMKDVLMIRKSIAKIIIL